MKRVQFLLQLSDDYWSAALRSTPAVGQLSMATQAGYSALLAVLPPEAVAAAQDHPNALLVSAATEVLHMDADDRALGEELAREYYTRGFPPVTDEDASCAVGWAERVRRAVAAHVESTT